MKTLPIKYTHARAGREWQSERERNTVCEWTTLFALSHSVSFSYSFFLPWQLHYSSISSNTRSVLLPYAREREREINSLLALFLVALYTAEVQLLHQWMQFATLARAAWEKTFFAPIGRALTIRHSHLSSETRLTQKEKVFPQLELKEKQSNKQDLTSGGRASDWLFTLHQSKARDMSWPAIDLLHLLIVRRSFILTGKMRLSISFVFVFLTLLLCSVGSSAKKVKDDDFSEFDDFDHDEFVVGTCAFADLRSSLAWFFI